MPTFELRFIDYHADLEELPKLVIKFPKGMAGVIQNVSSMHRVVIGNPLTVVEEQEENDYLKVETKDITLEELSNLMGGLSQVPDLESREIIVYQEGECLAHAYISWLLENN